MKHDCKLVSHRKVTHYTCRTEWFIERAKWGRAALQRDPLQQRSTRMSPCNSGNDLFLKQCGTNINDSLLEKHILIYLKVIVSLLSTTL